MYYFKLYKYLTNTYNINVIECMEPIYENIYMHAFVHVWYQQRHGFYYSYWIFRYEKSFSVLDSQTTDWRWQKSTAFLRQYTTCNKDDFQQRIVTTDETRLYHYDPKTKQKSSACIRKLSPPPLKATVLKICNEEHV